MHARTPDVAAPVRSTPGWDAGTHPGRAAALEGRARCRPRPPPGEAGWTLPRVPYNQRKCVPENSPAPAAQIARPFLTVVYRVTKPRARDHVTGHPDYRARPAAGQEADAVPALPPIRPAPASRLTSPAWRGTGR